MPPYLGICIVALLVMCAWIPARAEPQDQPKAVDRTDALRVFLDCEPCDEDYLRTEITFINYVRDRKEADLHVLVTTQPTGSGGTEYTLKFIGLERFAGVEQTLQYVAAQTNTEDETRRGFAQVFKLGLVRYVAETPLASKLNVTFAAPKEASAAAAVRDPWNFWFFRVGLNGNFEGEESQSERSIEGSLSANRTTDNWKMIFGIEGDYSTQTFTLDDGEIFTSVARELDAEGLVVKSLTDHWSAGLTGAAGSSIFSNYDFRARLAPGMEYDVFPYSQSTTRMLTFLYTIGPEVADYEEETIYGKTSETLLSHQLEASLDLRQPWGSASSSVEFGQYLNDADKYRVSAFGALSIRLFKGFEVEVSGEASRRRDQLSLRRGDATNEEILVRQRELATGYQYEFNFGFSYSFGSIYNNVVNQRFRNVDGF
jgi:Protein of unknown function, DUF481